MKLEGDTAILVSPVYDAELSQGCLRLGVFMFGADVGNLSLKQFSENNNFNFSTIGSLEGNYGKMWKVFLFNLVETVEPFQLSIEAEIGKSYLSDVALDSIDLLNKTQCQDAMRNYTKPAPIINTDHPSPTSCISRCYLNSTQYALSSDWKEGVCDCDETCQTSGGCCRDFKSMCQDIKTEPSQLTDENKFLNNVWILPGCLGLLILIVIVSIVMILRIRSSKSIMRRITKEGDEDGANILDEDDQTDRREDTEEFIDFTLATAIGAGGEGGSNTQWCHTTVSLSNRRVTSI